MSSLVHFFSKFSTEALFFESLGILALIAIYAAYWILRRKKEGEEQLIPASVVKGYLSGVIQDARGLHQHVFGLFPEANESAGEPHVNYAAKFGGTVNADPEVAQKVAEQALIIQQLMKEKMDLEQQVTSGAGSVPAPTGATVDNAELDAIKKKLQAAEDRLSEYSVIEDDLANLKRLQQENNKLKAQIAQGGGAVAAGPAAPAQAAAAAPLSDPSGASAAGAAAPAMADAATDPLAGMGDGLGGLDSMMGDAPAAATPEANAENASAASGTDAPAMGDAPMDAPAGIESDFEKLVDQVESSLEQPAADAVMADAAPLPAGTEGARPATKADEDLLSEFEKMLGN